MTKFKGFPAMSANFTPVPNAFFDHVLPYCPPCVVSVVGAIIRATVGWTDSVTGEKRIEAELSVPEIARIAKISQNSVRKGVRLALEEGLLVETAPAGLNTGARYALRWEDEERQKEAIERSRRATGDFPAPPSTFEGGGIVPPSTFEPPSKVEAPLIKKNKDNVIINQKKALNVRRAEDEAQHSQRSTLNARRKGIYTLRDRAVAEVVALTGDEGSLRRFQQLWEVAEGNESLDAWEAAVRATQRRLGANSKQGLERPGAYFDKICVQELEKREIFLPTIAQKQADFGVGELIRQELSEDSPSLAESSDPQQPPFDVNRLPITISKASRTAQLRSELEVLESQGGTLHEAFLTYVAAERRRRESEMVGGSAKSRQRLLDAFDSLENRLELFGRWRART